MDYNNTLTNNIMTNHIPTNNIMNIKKLDYIDDFNIWDIRTVFKYVISKPIEFLLLLLVFIIIYSVDYISHLNNAIYGMSQSIPIPFLSQANPQQQQNQSQTQNLQQKRKKGNK